MTLSSRDSTLDSLGPYAAEGGVLRWVVPLLAAGWSLFQLACASFLLLDSIVIRSVHLAFSLSLVFLTKPYRKDPRVVLDEIQTKIAGPPWVSGLLAVAGGALALYLVLDYQGASLRQGSFLARDLIVGLLLILCLLEGTRRATGPTLPIVVSLFAAYSFFSESLPGFLAMRSVTLPRFIGQITMSTEGIYGVPLYVSASIVFLFVLFGAFLDKAGAGKYFVDLAFSLLGRFRGGPAKAAILASGLTGMVSGSSIANTVTTGTFTIPLMKSVGYPAYKAGAIEVACSTNGQLMPPIMGAAAFIIAEYCNLPYLAVVRAAFIPAVISYLALIYIAHLEASKLGLRGLRREELPRFFSTLVQGLHFLIPILILILELVVSRHSAEKAAFRAILSLVALIPLELLYREWKSKRNNYMDALCLACRRIGEALVSGALNMVGIGVAVASAGIIVGVVNLGLGGKITEIIEFLSGNNFLLVLLLTAIASLLLGMGLPTTANYIVMATLMAPVIVSLSEKNGVAIPLIAAHLFVFFFGILADDTPPVGLAAFAASAIAKSNPIKTGIQGFAYDIRTAILPFMFVFNTDLLLIEVHHLSNVLWIFLMTLVGMFSFASLTQGYLITRNRWYESFVLLAISFTLLRPTLVSDWMGITTPYLTPLLAILLYGTLYGLQRLRLKRQHVTSSS